ncbi:MAG TPA: alkaline phosphatase D family protein [Casimicrobium sp.]|nr:alkaline phosphatase D family protein [Casimicrobium sp.]
MSDKPPEANRDAADDGYPEQPARRRALHAAGAIAVAPLLANTKHVDAFSFGKSGVLAFAPAAFEVHADKALIWVSANEAARLHVRWGDAPDSLRKRSAEVSLEKRSDFTGSVALTGLPVGATIFYRVFAGETAVSELCRFNAVRTAGQSFTLAFSGDTEEKYKPFRIFDTMAAAKPDFFMFLGDTVYADIPKRDFSPTVPHYRRKHAAIRADKPMQNFLSQCASFATWDDHEIQNDAHGGLAFLPEAEQVYREYWPCTSVEPVGLYRAFSLSPAVDLIILDTRRFRSVQALTDGPEKTMLGPVQKQWFLNALKRSKAAFKVVATSVPFHGSSQDAWGNYKTERDEIVAFIKREAIDNVVMISADYHFARDWSNKRTGIHEFMAGPLATFRTFDKTPNARERHSKGSHFVFGDDFNFGLLRYDARSKTLSVSYQDSVGKVLYDAKVASS